MRCTRVNISTALTLKSARRSVCQEFDFVSLWSQFLLKPRIYPLGEFSLVRNASPNSFQLDITWCAFTSSGIVDDKKPFFSAFCNLCICFYLCNLCCRFSTVLLSLFSYCVQCIIISFCTNVFVLLRYPVRSLHVITFVSKKIFAWTPTCHRQTESSSCPSR